jgi:hypothetical protein
MKRTAIGVPVLGGLAYGAQRFFGGSSPDQYSSIPQYDSPLAGADANLEQYFERIRELYGDEAAFDFIGQATQSQGRRQAALDAYLRDAGVASGAMSQDVEDRYRNLSLQMLGTAQAGQRTGQLTARDIDDLYGRLADEPVSGMDTGTITSGSVPMGGEMATAPQSVRTYGRSLADYLGAETGAATAAGERMAAATAGLGVGIGAGMRGFASDSERAQQLAMQMSREDAMGRAAMAQAAENARIDSQRREREAGMAGMTLESQQRQAPQRAILQQAKFEVWEAANSEWQRSKSFREWVTGQAAAAGVPQDQAWEWFSSQIDSNPMGIGTVIQRFTGEPLQSLGTLQSMWFGY